MAIVINPDGTVSTVETTHDQYGNLRPKIDSGTMIDQEIHYNKNAISNSRKKGYVYPTSTDPVAPPVEPKRKGKKGIPDPKKIQDSITTVHVNKLFNKLLSTEKLLSPSQIQSIKNKIPKYLHKYFDSKYEFYLEKIKKTVDTFKRTTTDPPKKIKKKKNKLPHQIKDVKSHHNSHSDFSIGKIATFSNLKDNYASSQDFEARTSNPPRPARVPKYAYARDRYGRVQERDSFNEEKRNEFYAAQNRQKHYDYSSYDVNDDNEGAYGDWE